MSAAPGGAPDGAPLVLALALDAQDQRRLDELRRRHFPPERLQVGAHVTLFHALPGEQRAAVLEAVTEACRRPAFDVRVAGARSLGRGAALVLRSAELDALRADLAGRFAPWLTRQDAQRFSAHVTVQNFVTPQRARETVELLSAELSAQPDPDPLRATGVEVHRYLGGPWDLLEVVPLA
ncbi:2'-5' RNA ligase family protein [Kineococcus indalonis]|uniref:2'-5' RNA ligase family protein n=1 Tax=Kineococcus indalonis TaxID=2696566 RepID=UPI001412FB25|nr:2'-5' RNA ligase family protein [Kineococcus indalonis]NAZ85991.1 2'-5' RNA ligase family protein [Kineococcus indalonis]